MWQFYVNELNYLQIHITNFKCTMKLSHSQLKDKINIQSKNFPPMLKVDSKATMATRILNRSCAIKEQDFQTRTVH